MNEIPALLRPKECQHCWHETNLALMSYPHKAIEACCWCGQTKTTEAPSFDGGEAHGPYKPRS